jgi:hypothetical protein
MNLTEASTGNDGATEYVVLHFDDGYMIRRVLGTESRVELWVNSGNAQPVAVWDMVSLRLTSCEPPMTAERFAIYWQTALVLSGVIVAATGNYNQPLTPAWLAVSNHFLNTSSHLQLLQLV